MPKGVGLKTEQMYLITLRPFTIERGATAIWGSNRKRQKLDVTQMAPT